MPHALTPLTAVARIVWWRSGLRPRGALVNSPPRHPAVAWAPPRRTPARFTTAYRPPRRTSLAVRRCSALPLQRPPSKAAAPRAGEPPPHLLPPPGSAPEQDGFARLLTLMLPKSRPGSPAAPAPAALLPPSNLPSYGSAPAQPRCARAFQLGHRPPSSAAFNHRRR
jgi:hypothetical protein